MQRTYEEAKGIADREFDRIIPSMQPYQYSQLIEILREYSSFYCDSCHKTGTQVQLQAFPDGKPNELITSACGCSEFQKTAKRIQEKIVEAGIPVRYHTAALGDWENPATTVDEKESNERSFKVIKAYSEKVALMKKKGYGLFVCGPNGVGKTYLLCAIAAICIREGFNLCYYTMPKIVQTIIGGWYEKDLQLMVSTIELADFLVIDDLDKAYASKTRLEIAVLDNLFRERLQNNRPMLVTSNKTLEQIKESHGNSVYSMFSEHCAPCVLLGSDFRKKMSGDMLKDILES